MPAGPAADASRILQRKLSHLRKKMWREAGPPPDLATRLFTERIIYLVCSTGEQCHMELCNSNACSDWQQVVHGNGKGRTSSWDMHTHRVPSSGAEGEQQLLQLHGPTPQGC